MKQDIFKLLTKPFIIEWWPTDSFAHGNSDYEHYYVKYYSPVKQKYITTEWCEAGCCGHLPFDNPFDEFDKFDEMGKAEYWKSYRVPEKYIKVGSQE